jgi:hypothetical protein
MDIKTYLGDSVYAKFDGYMLVVYTDNGQGPRNVIAMEPEVLASLIEFNDRARQQMRDALLAAHEDDGEAERLERESDSGMPAPQPEAVDGAPEGLDGQTVHD